jgi:hypothetical protein
MSALYLGYRVSPFFPETWFPGIADRISTDGAGWRNMAGSWECRKLLAFAR